MVTVIVHQRGRVEGSQVIEDPSIEALCDACGGTPEVVMVLAGQRICKGCMREALDASSIAKYRLTESSSGVPWGKVTG
jgi:hypothetical protein